MNAVAVLIDEQATDFAFERTIDCRGQHVKRFAMGSVHEQLWDQGDLLLRFAVTSRKPVTE